MKKLRQILPKDDTWKLVVLFIMMLIAGVLEVLGISIILGFVSQISDPTWIASIPWLQPILAWAGISESKDILLWGGGALFVIFFVKNIYLVLYQYIQAKYAYNRYRHISTNLFSRYMTMPYMFHIQHNSAALIRNVTTEANFVVANMLIPFLSLCMEIVLILSILSLLFFAEPLITLVVVLIVGGMGVLLLNLIRRKIKVYGVAAHTDRASMIQYAHEGIGGIKEIKILNTEGWFIKKFQTVVDRMVRSEIFKQVSNQTIKPIIEIVAVAGMLIIAGVLVVQGRDISSIVPILALFGVATFKLMPSVNKVIGQYNTLRYYGRSLSDIHVDLFAENKREEVLEKKVSFEKHIELQNVSFAYDKKSTATALKNISFTISKGESVGIIGSSGAGKTTLVDVILGLLTPQKGRILVDGVDIQKNISGWQKNIGYIPQFIYLSDDTIAHNIAFGIDDSEIDVQALDRAIDLAQLTDLIAELPNGVGTVVGESGMKLSGGQRQRIGIARALYHNPSVLIMDEATSALDSKTEQDILQAIEQIKKGRTIITIAHRMTTLENVDRMIVLEKGIIKKS